MTSQLPAENKGSLPVPASPVLPPALMVTTADDFLPRPGAWASSMGRWLLTLTLAGSGALALWPMRETVRAEGAVRPSGENAVVQSEQGGTVMRVLVQPNQSVRAGSLLAEFDNRSLQMEHQQLQQEQQALGRQLTMARGEQQSLAAQAKALGDVNQSLTQSSRQGVAQARTAQSFERAELERYRALAAEGAVPRSVVDERLARQIVSEAEVLKALQGVAEQEARGVSELARLRQAEFQARSQADELHKQLLQRQTRLQQLERAIAQTRVVAPIDGSVVSTALRHAGQVLPAGEPLVVIAPASAPLDVRVQVPRESISQVEQGQGATLRVSSCPTAEFGVLPAQVESVAADVQPRQDDKPGGYEVVLAPARPSLNGRGTECRLRPGMAVVADVVTRRTTVLMFLLNKLRVRG
jgi:multidrug efflux pump subunit AcrA (membrane-fusion protein)